MTSTTTATGTLFIVATPIGNLEDITIRAIRTLFSVDAILCEDTRRTGLLLRELINRYGEQFDMVEEKQPLLVSYYDQIEDKRLPEVIELLEKGQSISLVSDAGTPLISDPGFRLVREAHKRNIVVTSVPGSSAVLTALTNSGLPAHTFTFYGYPPEKQTQRQKLFTVLLEGSTKLPATHIFYVAPHKLAQTLLDLQAVCGNIHIVIARELTKVHEELWKGKVEDALGYFTDPKGEFVLLFSLPAV